MKHARTKGPKALNKKQAKTLAELLEMKDKDIENYIESLDWSEIFDLLIDAYKEDVPLVAILPDHMLHDLAEIAESDFTTIEVSDIICFLNALAGDEVTYEVYDFIIGTLAMVKLLFEEWKKENRVEDAKTAAN